MKKLLSLVLVLCVVCTMFAISAAYNDVPKNHFSAAAVDRFSTIGVVQGIGDGNFDVNGTMTRAAAAEILNKLLKLSDADVSILAKFSDMATTAWYTQPLANCVAEGIFNGYPDGKMYPDSNITREQLVAVYCRALGIEPVTTPLTFKDKDSVSNWASGYVAAMHTSGILKGYPDNTVRGVNAISRGEAVVLLSRSVSVYVNEPGNFTAVNTGVVLIVTDKPLSVTVPAETKSASIVTATKPVLITVKAKRDVTVVAKVEGVKVNDTKVDVDKPAILKPQAPAAGAVKLLLTISEGGKSASYTAEYLTRDDLFVDQLAWIAAANFDGLRETFPDIGAPGRVLEKLLDAFEKGDWMTEAANYSAEVTGDEALKLACENNLPLSSLTLNTGYSIEYQGITLAVTVAAQ